MDHEKTRTARKFILAGIYNRRTKTKKNEVVQYDTSIDTKGTRAQKNPVNTK